MVDRTNITVCAIMKLYTVSYQFKIQVYFLKGHGLMSCLWIFIVGFLLLQYSVVYAVESLSLFYLLFISRFVCTRR